jgi:hypothetical protein
MVGMKEKQCCLGCLVPTKIAARTLRMQAGSSERGTLDA